jgi:hypothetical protein
MVNFLKNLAETLVLIFLLMFFSLAFNGFDEFPTLGEMTLGIAIMALFATIEAKRTKSQL